MIFRTLRFRVPVSIVGLGLFSAMVIGAIGWTMARDGLTDAASDRLTLAAESRRTSIELVADKLRGDMLNFAGQKEITTNIMDLSETLAQPAEDAAKNLSYFSSPPEDERIQLDGAMSGTMYGIRHSKVHAIARQLMTQGGYEDVMLIDGNDRVVYTARKGADFGKQIGISGTTNPQLSALLAQLKSAKKGETKFLDFAASSTNHRT